MRVLCLHGTGAHMDPAQVDKAYLMQFFRSQLSGLEKRLGRDEKISFHFLRGVVETLTNPELDPSLNGPFYSYFTASPLPNPSGSTSELTLKSSPEDYARFFARFYLVNSKSVNDACTLIQQAVDEEGPFDGILGFSSGAAMAATYLLRQMPAHQSTLFQFAVFICGGPGLLPEGIRFFLADESDRRIGIPSIHVCGSLDPLYMASLALYNTCHKDSRRLLDHGKGHVMPWDKPSIKSIAAMILELYRKTPEKGILRVG